jgi:primosomal protein N'
MPEKPSKNEDEYFAKQSLDLIKAKRREAEKAALDAERRAHYMKCPKCGSDLKTESYHGIEIDRCPACSGMWLDAGEAEDLLRREDEGIINIFKSVMKGVGS